MLRVQPSNLQPDYCQCGDNMTAVILYTTSNIEINKKAEAKSLPTIYCCKVNIYAHTSTLF